MARSSIGPLSVISLGFLPDREARVTATVAGALVDVRSGFVYGTAEATAVEEQWASAWSSGSVVDAARVEAERRAFDDFADEFGLLWRGVVNTHAMRPPQAISHDNGPAEDTEAPAGYYRVTF